MVNFLFKLNLVSLQIYIQNNFEITLKIMKKYLEIYLKNWKNHGKVMVFFSLKKWEP